MLFELNEDLRAYLLSVARETIGAELDGRPPRFDPFGGEGGEILNLRCGAFVTLKKRGTLRGCIGRMTAAFPLLATVRSMAIAAAFEDPRFPQLSKDELALCSLEISVLSPMARCTDPTLVEVGKHGVYLVSGGRAGVFLPQVPQEQGWNRDEYLDHLCGKAGLPVGAYRDPDAELYTFTAVVFTEGEGTKTARLG